MRGTVGAILPPIVDKNSRGRHVCRPLSTPPLHVSAASLLLPALLLLPFDGDMAVLSASLKGGDVAGLLPLLGAVTWRGWAVLSLLLGAVLEISNFDGNMSQHIVTPLTAQVCSNIIP